MAEQFSTSPIEQHIKDLYVPTFKAYIDFFEDGPSQPYAEQPREREIFSGDAGLYFTTISKLAQQRGVRNQIRFQSTKWGAEEDMEARITYASAAERLAEEGFMSAHWNFEKHGTARELMIGFGADEHLLALTSLRMNVPLQEIIEVYPHVTTDKFERIKSTYEDVRDVAKTEPDLVNQLVVLQSLRDYYYDLFSNGNFLSKAIIDLMKIGQALNPTAATADKIYEKITDDKSESMYELVKKQTLEAIVSEGYGPITPKDYARWVLSMCTDD